MVLFMNLPGLCLFYGGMLDAKNMVRTGPPLRRCLLLAPDRSAPSQLSMFMTCTAVQCAGTLLWFVVGYSLVFSSGGNAFVGGLERAFMHGITPLGPLVPPGVPAALQAVFHSTYASITPCVVVGAYACRMKFSASILFCMAWMIAVYVPFARMVWGGGFLHQIGLIDFAGGVVIHVTAGVSALVAAQVIGPRKSFTAGKVAPPHNLVAVMVGAGIIWASWLGFNGGSTPSGVGPESAWVFLTSMAAAASGGVAWMLADTLMLMPGAPRGGGAASGAKVSALGASCGIVAGLVCITPAANFVSPWAAVFMGSFGAVVCRAACAWLRKTAVARGSDDACEVFGLHGTGGILGNAMTAIFAATTFGGTRVVVSVPAQFMLHNAAALGACLWAGGCTWLILKALDALLPGGIRVDAATEEQGLDQAHHGEEAYGFLADVAALATPALVPPALATPASPAAAKPSVARA